MTGGRYRTHHYFDENGEIYMRRDNQFDRKLKEDKLTTRKVDASGEIAFSGDPKVDGKVKDAVEMMQRSGAFGPGPSILHPAFVPLFPGSQRDAERFKNLDRSRKSLCE